MAQGDEVQPGQVVGGEDRGNDVPAHVEAVGEQPAAVHKRPSVAGPFQQDGLSLSDVEHPEADFRFEKGVDPQQRPDGEEDGPDDQEPLAREREPGPVHAQAQGDGDCREAEQGGPVRARSHEDVHARVALHPEQSPQQRFAGQISRMQEQGRRRAEAERGGRQSEKGQGQDDEPERGQPQQVERKTQRRLPEGVQHEGQGGDLRRDGAPERQPDEPQEATARGPRRRRLSLKDAEGRNGERPPEPQRAEPREAQGDARHRRKGQLHAEVVEAQRIVQEHAEQGDDQDVREGEGRAQGRAAVQAFGKEIGGVAQQTGAGEHDRGPDQRGRRVAEPEIERRQRQAQKPHETVGRKTQEHAGSDQADQPGHRQRTEGRDREVLARQGEAVRQARRVDAFHVRRLQPVTVPEQQSRDDGGGCARLRRKGGPPKRSGLVRWSGEQAAGEDEVRRFERGEDAQAQSFPQGRSERRFFGDADGGVILRGPRLKEDALPMPVVLAVPRSPVAEAVDGTDFQTRGEPLPGKRARAFGNVPPRQGEPAGERFRIRTYWNDVFHDDPQSPVRQSPDVPHDALHGNGLSGVEAGFQPRRERRRDRFGPQSGPPARREKQQEHKTARGTPGPTVHPRHRRAGRQRRNRKPGRDDARREQQHACFPEQQRLERRYGRRGMLHGTRGKDVSCETGPREGAAPQQEKDAVPAFNAKRRSQRQAWARNG